MIRAILVFIFILVPFSAVPMGNQHELPDWSEFSLVEKLDYSFGNACLKATGCNVPPVVGLIAVAWMKSCNYDQFFVGALGALSWSVIVDICRMSRAAKSLGPEQIDHFDRLVAANWQAWMASDDEEFLRWADELQRMDQ